jgi:hypothetical protein
MANYDTYSRGVTTDSGTAPGTVPGAAVSGGGGFAGVFTLMKRFAAATAGFSDDVTIHAADLPFKMRILDCLCIILTNVSGGTITLRDNSTGSGNALSSNLNVADAGTTLNRSTFGTATTTVAANGKLYIRRSDKGVSGDFVMFCMPEA